MEESFRVRIDKVFGSLTSPSAASSSSLNSLWCLADDEIDRNERSGEKVVPEPQPSVAENDPEDLSVNEDEGSSSVLQKPDDYNEEEWEIKSSIGMDTTLDMEEEEDENDKVAVGEEQYVFTKDVNDYETEADEWDELPSSFSEREKDPRANLTAAEIRLKEDADAVNKLNSLHVSEDNMSEKEKALAVSEEGYVGTSDDSGGLKPILKRKESQADSKLQKRVRFSSDVRDDNSTEGDKDSVMETSSPEESVLQRFHASVVPDYVRNPSKYTRYTFDEGEVDEESNRKAYMEFLNMIRKRDEPLEEPLGELPTSVAFVPKKKPTGESKVGNTDKGSEGRRGAIAIVDAIEDSTVSAMEEDEPETALNVVRRPGRQYRARAKEDQEE